VASANVELVRSLFADWERGDWGSTAWAHPEIEFAIADGPSPRIWVGIAGMVEGYREFLKTWQASVPWLLSTGISATSGCSCSSS
jgi:hypothetical protein